MAATDKQNREWAWEESKRKAPYHSIVEDRAGEFEMFAKIAKKPSIIDGPRPEEPLTNLHTD